MLQELIIKNLAIIDNLSISFEKGLNVLTGETGAGKSIIVDALSLALGERASSDMIKYGQQEGTVQALFEIEGITLPESVLQAIVGVSNSSGTDADNAHVLILKRVLSFSGKSRAYVNDNLVSISSLEKIGQLLVDIHGQHEHQSLMSKDTQLRLIDEFGNLNNLRSEYKKLYEEILDLKAEIKTLQENLKFKEQRADLLRYQINEISQARLNPDEEEALRQEYTILKNITKLSEAVNGAYNVIYGAENSCITQLSKILQKLSDLSSIDPKLAETANILDEVKPLLEEASENLRRLKERYDIDPERLDQVNERLELIERLKKKYGNITGGEVKVSDILSYLEKAKAELLVLENSDERLSNLEKELAKKEAKLLELAHDLSEKRMAVAARIEDAMAKELKEVALEKAVFKINLKRLDEPTKDGIDEVEFEFSANPGEPPRPLTKVVSGGELSRLMLCLKVILAEVDRIPVLIFDEVDAGIGGVTAEKVAQRLKKLSRHRQVLCITHLPQIASAADHHIKVEKIQKKDRVSVVVKALSDKERHEEIARMLSGKITDASLRHARELLGAYR